MLERREVTAFLEYETPGTSQDSPVGLAILRPRPVVVSVDQHDGDLDRRVGGASSDPGLPLTTEREKCAVMTWLRSAGPKFIDKLLMEVAGIINAALHDLPEDALCANAEDERPDNWQEHGREQHVGER